MCPRAHGRLQWCAAHQNWLPWWRMCGEPNRWVGSDSGMLSASSSSTCGGTAQAASTCSRAAVASAAAASGRWPHAQRTMQTRNCSVPPAAHLLEARVIEGIDLGLVPVHGATALHCVQCKVAIATACACARVSAQVTRMALSKQADRSHAAHSPSQCPRRLTACGGAGAAPRRGRARTAEGR